jgi:uncharacterized OsmC-like protein
MASEREVSVVHLTLEEGYRLRVDFGEEFAAFFVDEPPPLGAGDGPNASKVLGAAVASCLSASLAYCLRRAHLELEGLSSEVEVHPARDERGRLRIASMTVRLHPLLGAGGEGRVARCLELFEDFCVVTESVRRGIPVEVAVDWEPPSTPGAPNASSADTEGTAAAHAEAG